MIKAIILDVDGVIVGEKKGFNSPDPHPTVIQKLKNLREMGIPVILCTARPHYSSIEKIIEDAQLKNLHITNGGAVIIDPIDNVILTKHVIENQSASEIIRTYINAGIYTEFYTTETYFAEQYQVDKITEIHTFVLGKEPNIASSLIKEAENKEIVKIMPIGKNADEKERIAKIFDDNNFGNIATLSWGIHPYALPYQFGIITAKNISKKEGAEEIIERLNIAFEDILGVGDNLNDWQFMQLCGYVAAMGNAGNDLKQLVLAKGNRGYVGKSVDENGILDILKFFGI